MANEKFSIEDALKYGWETFKANIGFFIGLMAGLIVITLIPSAIVTKIFEPKSVGLVIARVILRLGGMIIGMGITRLTLDLYDTGEVHWENVTSVLPQIPTYLGAKLLTVLIVLVGFLLLIVPGVIASIMLMYAGYLVIDRNLGPIESLKESRAITQGYKLDLFLFTLVMGLVNLVGLVCLFVGLIATMPVTMMAAVYVYRRLSPRI